MGARTYRSGRTAQAGLSWLELLIVAGVLGAFAGSLLTALLYYEELAEAAVVQLTVRNIRSGLRYQIADRLVQGRDAEMVQLLTANTVVWLESPPSGYAGSVRSDDVGTLPQGSWFYDVDRDEIGYIPRHSVFLVIESGGQRILRWQVRALKMPSPLEVEGLMLVSVTPYRWF